MKKIVFALLIVLMLMMPACNAANGNVSPQSSSSVQNSQNLVSSSDTSEGKSDASEKDTTHASSSEKKRENPIGLEEYDAMLNTIDCSSVVCSLYNKKTFEDYYAEGMANVYDVKKAYALVKQFHGSYALYLTADGGKTWTNSKEGIVFLEKSYDDDSIPLPNGECLEFLNLYKEIPQYLYDTEVRVYGVNKENSSFYEEQVKGWFDIFNFGEDVSFVTEAEYCGDNSYHLTIRNRMSPGHNSTKNSVRIRLQPSLIMMPSSGVGRWTPSPRKDKPASPRMTFPRANVNCPMSCGMIPGAMCRRRIAIGDAPLILAACTYLRSLRLRVKLRVILAYQIQSTRSIATMMFFVLGPRNAMMSITRMMFGKDISALLIVVKNWSASLPK